MSFCKTVERIFKPTIIPMGLFVQYYFGQYNYKVDSKCFRSSTLLLSATPEGRVRELNAFLIKIAINDRLL